MSTCVPGPRLVAIVGPFQSGKTSLLEAFWRAAEVWRGRLSVREGTSIGDLSPEARNHAMQRRAQRRQHRLHGRPAHFLLLPRLNRIHPRDRRTRCPLCDAAIVVCEADLRKFRPCRSFCASRGTRRAAAPFPQQDRSGERAACGRRSRCFSPRRARRCFLRNRSRCGRTASPLALSSRARARVRLSGGCAVYRHRDAGGRYPEEKSRRAIRCLKSSRTMTTAPRWSN